jgi:hypothetical protein
VSKGLKQTQKRSGLLADMMFVIRREKKWWLIPLLLILLAATGLLLAVGVAGPLAPFIYPFL